MTNFVLLAIALADVVVGPSNFISTPPSDDILIESSNAISQKYGKMDIVAERDSENIELWDYDCFVLIHKDFSCTSFKISTDIIGRFTDTSLIFEKGSEVVAQISKGDLLGFSFGLDDKNVLKVDDPRTDQLNVEFESGGVRIGGMDLSDKIVVATMDGRIHRIVTDCSEWYFDYSEYESGIYVISVKNKSIKLFVK